MSHVVTDHDIANFDALRRSHQAGDNQLSNPEA